MIQHPIAPVYDGNSEILILGSFPSVQSREAGFFYGHPRNRFWRVLSALYDRPLPQTTEEKRALLLDCRIALWDVIARCEISGSADSSITQAEPNDLSALLTAAPIRQIYLNGKTAETYYRKYIQSKICRDAICLPSTSPANAAWSLERLLGAWAVLRENG